MNPVMLRIARESRGYSIQGLAEEAAVPAGLLSKVENELTGYELSPKQLSCVAQALGFPESFFAQAGRRYGFTHSFHGRLR